MNELQARLLAARSVRAAQAQEDFARRLRPGSIIPTQRSDEDDAPLSLTLVAGGATA